jgi:hypothetical protein
MMGGLGQFFPRAARARAGFVGCPSLAATCVDIYRAGWAYYLQYLGNFAGMYSIVSGVRTSRQTKEVPLVPRDEA